MLSFQVIRFLHFGQYDLPETTPFSKGKRYMQTFAKLPHRPPKIITNKKSTYEKNYILKFDVTSIRPSIKNCTINTASCR